MKGFFYACILYFTKVNCQHIVNLVETKNLLQQKLSIKKVILTWLLLDVLFNYQDSINAFMEG
jgi:hypothetical protein